MGIDLGNLAALRTFRVLRALKTVAIIPGDNTFLFKCSLGFGTIKYEMHYFLFGALNSFPLLVNA